MPRNTEKCDVHILPPSNVDPIFPRLAQVEPLREDQGAGTGCLFPAIPPIAERIRAFDFLREE